MLEKHINGCRNNKTNQMKTCKEQNSHYLEREREREKWAFKTLLGWDLGLACYGYVIIQ